MASGTAHTAHTAQMAHNSATWHRGMGVSVVVSRRAHQSIQIHKWLAAQRFSIFSTVISNDFGQILCIRFYLFADLDIIKDFSFYYWDIIYGRGIIRAVFRCRGKQESMCTSMACNWIVILDVLKRQYIINPHVAGAACSRPLFFFFF